MTVGRHEPHLAVTTGDQAVAEGVATSGCEIESRSPNGVSQRAGRGLELPSGVYAGSMVRRQSQGAPASLLVCNRLQPPLVAVGTGRGVHFRSRAVGETAHLSDP